MNLSHRPLTRRFSTRQEPIGPRAYSSELAGLLSMLLPGLGQFYLGRFSRGLLLVGISLGVLVTAILLSAAGPIAVLSLLVRPRFLLFLFVVNMLLCAFRLVAVHDAFRSVGGRTGGRHVTLALLIALTAAPHVAVGYYDIVTMDTLDEIFSEKAPNENRVETTNEEYKLTFPVAPNVNVTVIPPDSDE